MAERRIERVKVTHFYPNYGASVNAERLTDAGGRVWCSHAVEHRQFVEASDSSDFYICKGCGIRMEILR